jgi:Tfp pilus assembly protein FimT
MSFIQSIQVRQQSAGETKARSAPARLRAFSIFELVIVCLIMSVLAAVAGPKFYDSLLFHRVESAARRVKSDLELARSQARLSSASQTITFASSAYSVANVKSLDNPNSVYAVNLKKDPYFLDSATANFSNLQTVTFDGYGLPASGGTIVLTAKTHQCTVTLNGATGDVTITSSHSGSRTSAVSGS